MFMWIFLRTLMVIFRFYIYVSITHAEQAMLIAHLLKIQTNFDMPFIQGMKAVVALTIDK